MTTSSLVKRYQNMGENWCPFCRVAKVKRPWFLRRCVPTRTLSIPENHWCLQITSVLHNFVPYFKCTSTSVLLQCQQSEHYTCNCIRVAASEKLSSAIISHLTAPFHKEGCSIAAVGCSAMHGMALQWGAVPCTEWHCSGVQCHARNGTVIRLTLLLKWLQNRAISHAQCTIANRQSAPHNLPSIRV
jgi:hypothetical protein